jgi:hypothetical protein
MSEGSCGISTLDALRAFVHKTLCDRENILADQFAMTESRLIRQGQPCGLQFSLQGPRSIRLGAIWAADRNLLYFYDACGERFLKLELASQLAASFA